MDDHMIRPSNLKTFARTLGLVSQSFQHDVLVRVGIGERMTLCATCACKTIRVEAFEELEAHASEERAVFVSAGDLACVERHAARATGTGFCVGDASWDFCFANDGEETELRVPIVDPPAHADLEPRTLEGLRPLQLSTSNLKRVIQLCGAQQGQRLCVRPDDGQSLIAVEGEGSGTFKSLHVRVTAAGADEPPQVALRFSPSNIQVLKRVCGMSDVQCFADEARVVFVRSGEFRVEVMQDCPDDEEED